MTEKQSSIGAHYTVGQLAEKILAALGQMKGDLGSLTPAGLAAVDEFHNQGGEAPRQLAQLVNLQPSTDVLPGTNVLTGINVLDVGCGLGGSARYLAHKHGCQVVGVDLTEKYCGLPRCFPSTWD